MFIVIYEFEIHEGQERAFETSWARVTDAIYEKQGSLGSRLHRSQAPGHYIAYAQWPSAEVFQNSAHDNYDEAQLDAMAAMKATIKHADIMNMLAVADDRLHSKPFGEA